jgi:glycosyltransferase involved in cell wall biosynthesis
LLISVSLVRNECAMLPVCVANLLHQGVDVVLIADHGSTDGTAEWLAEAAAADPRVQWTRLSDPGFHQSDAMTTLARIAAAAGATWVLPVDADELWIAADESTTLAEVLRGDQEAAALETSLEDFPPPVDLARFDPAQLARFRWRLSAADGVLGDGDLAALARGDHSFLAHTIRSKWVARAAPDLVVGPGAHSVAGLADGPVARTDRIRVLHLPLRDRHDLRGKRDHGQRLRDSGFGDGHGWQQQMLLGLDGHDDWDRLWRANSVGADGRLPSGRVCDEVVEDDALARLVARLANPVPSPAASPPRLLRQHGLAVARRQRQGEREGAVAAADLQARLRVLGDELARARAAAEASETKARYDAARADQVLSALRATWSWRLTRPWRVLARGGRGPRSAVSGDGTGWAGELVDPDWYLAAYPDTAGQDPVRHYALWGAAEGRLPRPPDQLPG